MARKARFDSTLVAGLVSGHLEGSAWDWLTKGVGSIADLDDVMALSVIEAAFRTERFDRLVAARDEAEAKVVRKAAGAALHRARAAGKEVAEERTSRRWELAAEEREVPPPTAFLGLPDMQGYCSFAVVVYGEDDAHIMIGEAGAGQGYRQVESTVIGRSAALREVLDDIRRHRPHDEAPVHEVLHYVEHAFDIAGRFPPGWDAIHLGLDSGLKNAARLLDPVAGLPEEVDTDLISDATLIHPSLMIEIPVPLLAGALAELRASENSELELSEATRRERSDRIVDDLARQIFDGVLRKTWTYGLEVAAWQFRRRGLDDAAQRAWNTVLALRSGMQGHRIGPLRGEVDRSLRRMVQMVDLMGPPPSGQ